MTLTKNDLQAIRQVVKEETVPQFQKINKRLVSLEKGQAKLEKGQAKLEKGQRKMVRELDSWTKFFDKDHIKLVRRVDRIENKLDITPPEF